MDPHAHWNAVYTRQRPGSSSWFQPSPDVSLQLLERAGMTAASCVIDIGGGDSELVDRLLDRGLTCVYVLDISHVALERARARLGARHRTVAWIEADVTSDWDVPTVEIWHDRALFHFLTDAEARRRYIDRLRRAVRAGGAVVIASFALDGPTRCSGLPVLRYSSETLAAELGAGFAKVESVREEHVTPSGARQTFSYTRFTRDRTDR